MKSPEPVREHKNRTSPNMHPLDLLSPEKIKTNAKAVRALLHETGRAGSVWTENDFGPLLSHQLRTLVQQEISCLLGGVEKELAGLPSLTFGELFDQPAPPLNALKLVKDFAKRLEQHAREAYPPAVATTLYYAAIAAAECHVGASISSLSKKDRHKGYAWAATQPWMPDRLKRLFVEALQTADPPR